MNNTLLLFPQLTKRGFLRTRRDLGATPPSCRQITVFSFERPLPILPFCTHVPLLAFKPSLSVVGVLNGHLCGLNARGFATQTKKTPSSECITDKHERQPLGTEEFDEEEEEETEEERQRAQSISRFVRVFEVITAALLLFFVLYAAGYRPAFFDVLNPRNPR